MILPPLVFPGRSRESNIQWTMFVRLFVCLFSIEIQTASPISVTFGLGIFFNDGKVLSCVLTQYPNHRGQGAQNRDQWGLCSLNGAIWQGLKRTKVVEHPCFSGGAHVFGIWIWKDLGSICFWRHSQTYSGKVYKTKVVVQLPSSKLGLVLIF